MAAPGKYQEAQIVSRKDHAKELWSIRLRTEPMPTYEPGQYLTLGVEDAGKVIERAYSVASAPHEEELEFFFELVPHGELTPRLHALQPGDRLLLRPRAKGVFTLDRQSGHQHHLLAGTVTGVAPYLSMVRALAREAAQGRAPSSRLVVLEAASRSWELGYREELEGFAQAHAEWLRFLPSVSRPWEDEAWRGERGRVEDVLRKVLDGAGMEPGNTTVYLCGHPGMIENCKGILLRRGFAREDIRIEVYWMPPKK
jgi:ferredoxin--NADP+ reductase